MNHKNSSTDNKPHANPANFEMIRAKRIYVLFIKKKNKIRPIPTLFQNCLQPIYRYYYLKNNSIIIYINLWRIKNFPKISQFRITSKNTRSAISRISYNPILFFFLFQRLRRFKTFSTVCILISHPRRCIASAQQVTRFKIVNISFDDRIGSKFARYTPSSWAGRS